MSKHLFSSILMEILYFFNNICDHKVYLYTLGALSLKVGGQGRTLYVHCFEPKHDYDLFPIR